ncbi:protein POLYCHOME-like [Magnolia sinica]|uniref:protein POLYCHOME-like n=1 Tax=Magnolia sinica TaxID=86752 RepID=UPI002658A140|nr:protein POLYCHOME-like [Magnolia sinica]
MPEARDGLPVGRTGPGDRPQGFRIRRGFYVAAAPVGPRDRQARNLFGSPSDNKENIPQESSSSQRRRGRPRKSPLPSWYPRTPLRDITAVVHAIERRRARLRAAAELRRRNQESADSSPFPLLTSRSRQELSISEQIPPPIQDQDPLLDISDSSLDLTDTIEKSPRPVEHPLGISPDINKTATYDLNPTTVEKKCQDSIDQIQRFVMESMQPVAKMNVLTKKKPERSTLMSMR